jgi:hypothetical protein
MAALDKPATEPGATAEVNGQRYVAMPDISSPLDEDRDACLGCAARIYGHHGTSEFTVNREILCRTLNEIGPCVSTIWIEDTPKAKADYAVLLLEH